MLFLGRAYNLRLLLSFSKFHLLLFFRYFFLFTRFFNAILFAVFMNFGQKCCIDLEFEAYLFKVNQKYILKSWMLVSGTYYQEALIYADTFVW